MASTMIPNDMAEETLKPTAKAESQEVISLEGSNLGSSSAFNDEGWKGILAICSPMAFICVLVWLDETILATSIPRISDSFQSFDQIGWYGPSYLFGLCASQLPFGRAYKDLPSKLIYVISLLIFEAASILQGAAPSSEAFIVGRIFAGVGGSGVLTGSLTIFSEEVPKAKLPYVMGAFGLAHSIGGIAGPIVGGAITSSSLTWRWCFYINPIISVVALIPVVILWRGKIVPGTHEGKSPYPEVLTRFDYPGIIAFAGAVVTLLLGLQFGGSTYSWSDGRTIALLVTAVTLTVIFTALQWWKNQNALVPKHIMCRRVVILSSVYSSTLDGAYFILAYQLPLWFQSISNLSARDSGYRILPLVASCIFATAAGTAMTGKLHYYHPMMLLGAILLTVGSALLTTMTPGISSAKWVLYQIIAGAGTGLGTALPLLAVQDALAPDDVPVGYAVVLTAGYLASAIALAAAQAVFASRLKIDLHSHFPGVDPDKIINAGGATDIRTLLPSHLYERGLQLFNTALTQSWNISVGLGGLSALLVLGFKWRKMDMRDAR